jgi:hypothetical protein
LRAGACRRRGTGELGDIRRELLVGVRIAGVGEHGVDLGGHHTRARVTLCGFACEGPLADRVELGGDVGVELAGRPDRALEYGLLDGVVSRAAEKSLVREGFP